MKKRVSHLTKLQEAFFAMLLLGAFTLKAQIPSTYQKGTWKDFKTAAITYSFDDNTSNQHPVALPLFDNYGYKVTFFAVTQSMTPNWTNLKAASNNGHEVGSHTVTHLNLQGAAVGTQDTELKNSQSTIQTQITNKKCVTVAYPNCNIGDMATIQKYYIAGRTCSGQIVSNNPTDFYSLSSIICGNTGVNTAADMNTRINSAKSSGGWCHFLMHGIDSDGGYSPLAASVLSSHLTTVNTNKADYWVGTFGDVVKYIKERNAITFTETTVSADSLRITPTDGLDNTIYDVGVTLRRQLPATWTDARVMIGTTIVTSAIVTISNVKYIQFDAIPDKGVYTIANKASTNTGGTCTTVAPTVTTPVSYVQNASATALTATGTSLKWYGTNATAGTASTTAPTPSTTVVGTYNYYVSQTLNTCEGPRASIVVNITASTGGGTGGTTCTEAGGTGAYYTGVYRNLFKEVLNKTDAEIKTKVDAAFQQIFYGSSTQQLYYPVGTDMAYILDVNNNDVRTEGMSYGMMICVQMDKKAEFDKIWKWSKTYMQRTDGYFNWQLNTNGTVKGTGPASDGEAYFVTALFFAANRWGNGTGINNYAAEAQSILQKVMAQGGNSNLFNATSKLITFVPNGDSYTYTDPSYNLPGFWELWAKWSTTNQTFWAQTPDASRKLLRDASHSISGLYADYSNFDGTPKTTSFNADSHRFMYDAWRTIMNLGMDYHWFKKDAAQQTVIADRYLTFFKNQGMTTYKNHANWDGSNISGDHATGLVACNAVAAFAATPSIGTPFVQEFWNVAIPTGTYRYYDGMLYMLALLNCSDNFKIWKPACQNTCATTLPTVTASINYELNEAATPLNATGTSLKWYTNSSGGTALASAPTPSTSSVGSTIYYVSQTANGCEGNRASITINVFNNYKIFKITSPITIDGTQESVWNNGNVKSLDATKLVSGTATNNTDISGYGKMLWDNTYLYLLAVVTDDTKQNDSQNSYDDDQVEFYIDVDNAKATTYDANDYQYSFGWNDGTVVGVIPSAGSVTSITYSAVATTNGYVIEARIPWATIQATPLADKLLGIDFMINDDDDGTARDAKLSWNSATDNAYKDASLFGVGVLMDQQLVTSLEDTQLMHFSVYPNPATDLITVDGLDGEFDYQLFDNTGKVLQSGNAINSIQLESLTTGIYFLGLSQNTKTRTVKVIVK